MQEMDQVGIGMDCGDTRKIKELTLGPSLTENIMQPAAPGNGLELVESSDDEHELPLSQPSSQGTLLYNFGAENDAGDSKGFW